MPDPKFAVIHAIARAGGRMGIEELAKAVGLDEEKLRKILGELEKLGVVKVEDKTVVLVARVAGVGA